MADFTLTPDYVFEETPEFNTLISDYENNVEQRRNKVSNPRRKWRLVYKNRPTSDFTTVRDFLINKKGAYSSFTWTNPNDNVLYTVRFLEDSINFQRKAYGVYDFSFVFIEVI